MYAVNENANVLPKSNNCLLANLFETQINERFIDTCVDQLQRYFVIKAIALLLGTFEYSIYFIIMSNMYLNVFILI